jgi:hypothetical protein
MLIVNQHFALIMQGQYGFWWWIQQGEIELVRDIGGDVGKIRQSDTQRLLISRSRPLRWGQNDQMALSAVVNALRLEYWGCVSFPFALDIFRWLHAIHTCDRLRWSV